MNQINHSSDIFIYQTDEGTTKIETRLEGESVWLTQDQMTTLFQRDKSVISRHIKNIFEEGELVENSVVAKYATTAADGKKYDTAFYNLDVMISVGYHCKKYNPEKAQQII